MQGPSSQTAWAKLENSLAYKFFLISMYLGSNISLNMLNKWTLSLYGFRFPLLMSLAHMAFSFLALGPVMLTGSYRELHRPTLEKQWVGVLAIGAFFTVNVGFNNISLVTIPLSLNQVIRASIPVVAAIGAVFIEHKQPSPGELFGLVVLVVGVAIAVWEGSGAGTASFTGIMLCLGGTVSNGLMMSSIGRLMSEKLDALRLTFYTAPISCVMMLPFYFIMENSRYQQYAATHSNNYIGLLLLGCINALMYNVVHVLTIKVMSSVTTTVIGEMKIVMILLLSAALLGEDNMWTIHMVVGCTTAIIGFCLYSHAKLQSSAASSNSMTKIKGMPELGALGSGGWLGSQVPLLPKPLPA